ncbi:MAG: 2-dehydropantoate 2-reductase [Alphaproteobacteria bacterium]|nr:2-dehydropantoate 2-reductase [Alphaproteobacteria bacterium]
MQKVAILGSGAIGCYVGGKLHATGHAVTFLGRDRTVNDLRHNGLTLTQMDGPDTMISASDIEVTSDAAALSDHDIILVCVKSQDTESAASEIASHSTGKPTIVSLQNGVSNARVLGRHLGARPIAAGCVQFNVVVQGEGRFHRATEGGIIVKDTPATRQLANALNASGIETSVHSDMQAILWTKLLLNLNNALNTLADVPIVEQLSDRSYRLVLAHLVDEALSAMRAAHIKPAVLGKIRPRAIPYVLRMPTWLFKRAAHAMLAIDPKARSSMWEDLRAQRASEIDFLNGAVVALGRETQTGTRANEVVVDLVHEAFSSGQSPKLSGKALLEKIRG